MLATLNAGDEAIIPTPCWVSYPDIVTLADGKPVFVPCGQNNGFKLRAEDLEAAITPRTKWFILNNPCNPTGAAYSAAELRPICDVLLRHPDVWIFTDDIYEKLAYDGFKPATIVRGGAAAARAHDDHERLQQGLCDDRLAHRLRRRAASHMIKAMDKLQSQSDQQHQQHQPGGGAGGADRAAGFHRRDGRGVSRAPRPRGGHAEPAPGITCHKPEGAFYVFPSMHGCIGKTTAGGATITDDESFVIALLEEEGVAAVHGAAFMLSRPFPHQLRHRHRKPARGLHAHPALLPGVALTRMPGFAARLDRARVARHRRR